MGLSNDLISQFVKATKAEKPKQTETTSYGTIVESDGSKWVKLDGSDQLTPINTTAVVADGDRVTVLIKDHSATVTGNLSDPAASSNKVTEMVDEIAQFEIVVADKVSTKELEAQVGRIDTLVSDNVIIKENLIAAEADISELRADNVTISGKLTAAEGEITNLKTDKLDASIADIKYATIGSLEATDAKIYNLEVTYGEFEDLVADKFVAIDAEIKNLDVGSLTVEEADIRYASIADLNAAKADITDLNADVANIDTLIFGSASGNVISTNFANAVIAQLGDAQIKSAMIESITAGQITAGDIITNNVRVLSEDGKLLISDETIQISDETRVRVQIGKDASGDYSINIWDADGNLMFSEGGITDNAIKDAIIRNDMVSENANIAANKLNIDSLFTVINEDGSNTLSSSKILLDADNQTLDVAFKNMTTKVETVEETINLTQAAVNQNAADMAEIVLKFNTDIENLQTQIDGGITTWFYEVPPSADNEPESFWLTDEMKNTHLGDLYYDTEAGTCYRYMLQDGEYFWQQVSDTDVAKALEDAKAAKDLADQKRRVFYEQPKPPYDKGDLWVQGANGDILRCQTTKTATQSFDQSDWVLASKYTDDTAADAVMAEVVIVKETVSTQGTQLTTIQGQINSKIWEQDITNAVTTLEGEITETTDELSTRYSELNQKVDGISTTVADHTTLITNKADISSVTEVSDKVSNLEQNVEGFKTTVSDTYATKTDLGEINETVTATQQAAQEAKKAAEDADAKAVQAKADLETAEQNLIDVASRVDATEEEIAAAQEAVTKAQNTADTAASNAATAKDAADKAQEAADEAQEIANQAKEDVDGLASRVSTAETNITQNAQKIELAATKSEIAEILEGYYTIDETEAAIKLESDSIITTVSEKYVTNDTLNNYSTTSEMNTAISTTAQGISQSVSNLEKALTDNYWTSEETESQINQTATGITSKVTSLETIINTKNQTFEGVGNPNYVESGEEGPTGNPNSPSIAWIAEGTEANHVGDLYVDNETGYLYRWELNEDVYSWERVKDGDINEAQNWADKAQSEIDAAEIRLSTAESSIEQLADSIKFLVTDENGETLMTQTSTGWTFDISKVQGDISKVQNDLSTLEGELGSTDAVVDALQKSVEELEVTGKYVRVIDYQDEPCVEICKKVEEGDGTESVFRVLITSTRIMFMENDVSHTYIDGSGLVTDNITVENELVQKRDDVPGCFVWQVRANGNYGLMYRGGE